MNVLHIISGGETGGSKKHLLTLSKDLAKKGVKNIIICLMKGALYDEAGKMGLDIRLVEQTRRFDMGVVADIKRICEYERIDMINCHGGRANFLAWFLKKRYRAKYVTTVHSDYRDDYRGNFYKTLVYSNINKLSLKSFNGYITVSHSFKDMLRDRGFDEKRIFTVYNGIDFTIQRQSFIREDIVKKYSLGNHRQYVTVVARLHPVKGHSVFLEACRNVLSQKPDTGIILVGDGDLMEELKKYTIDNNMENNVYFVGHQSPDEFIYIADFTVLASYTESFPMVLLESAFFEKTAVSSNVGGIPMLIEDGVNGYLVPPGDSSSMSEKILSLLSNREMTLEFGKRLYDRAASNFSSERMARDYIDIYKRFLAGGIEDEQGNLPRG